MRSANDSVDSSLSVLHNDCTNSTDANVPTEEEAWQAILQDVLDFIQADTKDKKVRILDRWNVWKGKDGKWGTSLPEEEKEIERGRGALGKIREFRERARRFRKDAQKAPKEMLRDFLEPQFRKRKEIEDEKRRQEKERGAKEHSVEDRTGHIVVPELPEGN